jgi:hypothetical protein
VIAALLACATVVLLAQPATTVSLEILPDGTCSIAVRGAGARSEMSYLPKTPGRCAIPTTRRSGVVRLEVLLPRGSAIPAASIPELTWSLAEGRPRGVAELGASPEFVDIMPPRRSARSRVTFVVLMGVAMGVAFWAFRHGKLQKRGA